MQPYWLKQTATKPLFPDLLWSRPEHRAQAGKLLIVGGNAHGFAAAGEAYAAATQAGIGTARVLLPDSLRRTVGKVFAAGEYAPSTPSGSFGRRALAELLELGQWADGTLLAGDFGRNSETAILLEQFGGSHAGQLTLTKDAADYFLKNPAALLARPDTLLVLSFAQAQKLFVSAHFPTPLRFDMDFLRLVDALHEFTGHYAVALIIKHLETIFVAVGGQVSTTKPALEAHPGNTSSPDTKIWRVKTAARASTWWLQNPAKPFEALTTSVLQGHLNHS